MSPDLGARESAENFPVALKVLPRRHRQDLHAVYAFARTVDELGDSAPGDRVAQLRHFEDDLDRLFATGGAEHPVLRGLRPTIEAHGLVAEPFHRLVLANLQDQAVHRYETFDDLVGYCRLSADPVGRIVLGIFDVRDARLTELSDKVCTALQLVEHWQDVAEDRRAGRVYLPQDDLRAHHVDETHLDLPSATVQLAELIRFETERAAGLLAEGAPIVRGLDGWARVCVAGFVAGGAATVAALRRTKGDVLAHQAKPSKAGTLTRVLAMLATGGRRGARP